MGNSAFSARSNVANDLNVNTFNEELMPKLMCVKTSLRAFECINGLLLNPQNSFHSNAFKENLFLGLNTKIENFPINSLMTLLIK